MLIATDARRPPDPASKAPIGALRITILVASVALLAISAGGMYLVVVALKPIASEFNWARAVPSFGYSLQFIGSGFGGLLMGYLLDRLGFGVPALIGGVMVSTGAMLVSFIDPGAPISALISPEYQLYVIYGIMFGLAGQGCLVAPGMANIARFFSRRRGMAVGVVASGQSLAGIVWPPVFGAVLADHGWRNMFFYYGVFAFVTLLPLAWFVRHKPKTVVTFQRLGENDAVDAAHRAKGSAAPLAPGAMQWTLCAAIVGCCVAMALPLAHLVALVTDLGFSIIHGAQALAILLVAAFVSRVALVGLLADTIGGLSALFAFSLIQAATLALFIAADALWSVYLVAVLFGVGYGGIFPVYTVIVREHIPIDQVGRRNGMVFLFGAAAMGLGSWMGGYLFDLTGSYTAPFLIGVAFNLANLAIVGFLIGRTGGIGRPRYIP